MEKKSFISSEIELVEMETVLMSGYSGGGTGEGDPQIDPNPDGDDDDPRSRNKNVWEDEEV